MNRRSVHIDSKTSPSNVICYYHGSINVSLLNPHICTHIIYTSIGIDRDGNIKFPYADEIQVLSELNFLEKMRKINENLKLLLSIGDNCEDQRRSFNLMLSSQSSRKNFAKNILGFCRKCNFDGIDINCQYPQKQQSGAFIDLIKKLKELINGPLSFEVSLPTEFEVFNFDENVDPQILSVTVNAHAFNAYDIKHISKKVKFINLIIFDMEMPSRELINLDHAVSIWLSNGANLNKLNIGVATYGCNDSKAIRSKANYAKFGGFGGVVIHSFDGDDCSVGFPLIRSAFEAFNEK
ncbi:chitinase-3-like protein 1 [Chironomus tepperi]|uniref:chitinase-3-like protein 1 n=1 Tax=Chironomus tepperi TaxID=113505 RepID=UPI00391F27A5